MVPEYVYPGQAIEARQINAIIDFAREIGLLIGAGGKASSASSRTACACINDDAEVSILAGEPCYIDPNESEWHVNTPILHVLPYDGTQDYPIAVARFDMDAGEAGEVILRGLAVLKVAAITAGDYLTPNEDGEFEFTSEATSFRLVGSVLQADDTSSTTKVLALVDGTGGGIGSLGVITQRPSGGAGAAVWQTVTLDANGNWTASGTDIPVVIPQF